MKENMTITERIFKGVAVVMVAVLTLGLYSCSADDITADDSRLPRTVVLKIVPGIPGDLNATRAYATDGEAVEGEFINTLCVYMVDAGGYVEKVIKPDFEGDEKAGKGNLDEYTSEEFQITPGRRSFYAFANWGDTAMKAVVDYKEGEKFDRNKIESLMINDPASKVDIANGKYIPMFGMLEEADIYSYVTPDSTIRIPIERLVSRLRLTLQPNSELTTEATIKKVTVSGFADGVVLNPNATPSKPIDYGVKKEFTPAATDGFKANKDGTAETFADVYVNETKGTGFKVEMEVTQYGRDVTYTGQTSTKDLPRNHIFPLNVKLSALELDVKAEVIAPPIGVVMEPVPVPVYENYNIEIVEGATFTITPKMPGVTDVQYNWITKAPTETDWIVQPPSADGSLSGTVTAVQDKTVTLQLDVNWKTNGQTYSRTYNITITTIPLDGWIISSAARWGSLSNIPAFWNK